MGDEYKEQMLDERIILMKNIYTEYISFEEFKKKVETCSEVMLYLLIDRYEAYLLGMNYDNTDGRIKNCAGIHSSELLVEMESRIRYARNQVLRFGVKGKKYEKWFKRWDSWKNKMSEIEWKKFMDVFPHGNYQSMLPK